MCLYRFCFSVNYTIDDEIKKLFSFKIVSDNNQVSDEIKVDFILLE